MNFLWIALINYLVVIRCQTCQDTWTDFVVQQSGTTYLKVDTSTKRVTVNDALFVGTQDVGALLSSLQMLVNQLKIDLASANTQIAALKSTSAVPSTTFIHYGLQTCPAPSTLVYSGQLISGNINHGGATVNFLCLPSTGNTGNRPKASSASSRSVVYQVEYQTSGAPLNIQDLEASCAVCELTGKTLMIPGRDSCVTGWTRLYAGYLMSSYTEHPNKETICVDQGAIGVGHTANTNGAALYHVEIRNQNTASQPNPIFAAGSGVQTNDDLVCVVCYK